MEIGYVKYKIAFGKGGIGGILVIVACVVTGKTGGMRCNQAYM
jgi:hypothetical protein